MNLQPITYQIRRPRLEDVEPIAVMHAQSWRDTYPNDEHGITQQWVDAHVTERILSSEALQRRKKYLEAYVAQPDKKLFYRIVDDTTQGIVGLIIAEKTTEAQEMGAMYLDKSVIGTGIAQELFDQLLEWIDPKQPIVTDVVAYNARAIRFYEKQGFVREAGTDHLFADTLPSFGMIRKATT